MNALTGGAQPAKQRGLSLIELMIAMVIGCILILGITEIFINNQKSYLFQQSQLGNQENGRFTLAILDQELSKAGYRSLPSKPIVDSGVAGCVFAPGASVVALSTTSLCIQYQASSKNDVTCQGTGLSSTAQSAIVKPYSQVNPPIVEIIAFELATHSITCTTNGVKQQLVNGIADFRFDYGTGDAAGNSDGNSKSVTGFSASPNATQTVGAVRYAALMQSGSPSIRDTVDKQPAALIEWNRRFSASVSDSTNTLIYQSVQSTIMLRNQLP